MPTPIVYRSTDASAPVLDGTAGSAIAVLKGCLVTGYGAKGAAGWTEEYTDTNKSALKMGSGGTAVRMFLRVDDSGTTSARLRGFVSMSDVDTGVEPFPTNAQIDGGGYLWKSSSADSTARPWLLMATSTSFYFLTWCDQTVFGRWGGPNLDGSTSTSQSHGIFFGEYEYVGSGFEYNVAVICSGSSITYNPRLGAQYSYATGISGSSGHYMARSPFATVGSHAFHKCQLTYGGGIQTNTACPIGVQTGPINQPDAVSGNIRFTRLQILCGDPVYSIAGYLPGFWGALVNVGIGGAANSEANHMLIDGSGELEGHQLLLLVTGAGINTSTSFGVYNAQIALDITAWP